MKNSFFFIIFIFFTFDVSSQSKSWDTQDLNVTKFRNGDDLFFAKTDEEWNDASENGKPAYCFYEGDVSKGVLYNWFAVNDLRGLAPFGWRVPDKRDFENLNKSQEINNREGNNKFILDLKYNGYRTSDGFQSSIGQAAYFWTITKVPNYSLESYSFLILKDDKKLILNKSRREEGCNVRCIRNSDEELKGLPPRDITGKSPICLGEQITLKTLNGELDENSKWVWYQNEVVIGEGESVVVKPSSSTIYKVRAESFNGKFSDFIKKEIQVNTKPLGPKRIDISSNVQTDKNGIGVVCEGSIVTFSVIGDLSTGSNWNWIENGKVVSKFPNFNKEVNSNSTIYLAAENSVCGNSEFIAQEIRVLKKSISPIAIYSKSVSYNETKLYLDMGSLGDGAQWKWYRRKKNGELKYLNKGREITINSFKTRSYVVKAEGGLCDLTSPKLDCQFYKNAKQIGGADWNNNYSKSTGLFHFGFELGFDFHNLSDSIHVLDSIFNFRAKSSGLNFGLSFHPIMKEFFTLGTRTNFIIDFGKINNSNQFQQFFSESTNTINPSYLLAKSSVGAEMLFGVLPKGKLKLLIDYDLSNYRTVKNFRGSSFSSFRLVKKETTSIGFRIGAYAYKNYKNSVQLDVLYSLSNFNESPLFDFSQSLFNHSTNLRNGFKLRLLLHNIFKFEAGIIYSINPLSMKTDFNAKNAMLNFGLVWSFDRFY
jgi:uncharacterized protein (TIGR02145 family)